MFYLRADIALEEIEYYPNVLHREEVGDDIPAWSEEDEKYLSDTILFVKTGTYSLDKEKLFDWINSLKPT